MKTVKRLFILLLSLALAFTLALPAFAEDDEPASPMPVITVQPERISTGIFTEITLRVEAEIPNGDPLGYQWYDAFNKKPIEGAVAAEFCFNSDDMNMFFGLFNCVVYNSNDSTAEAGPNRVVSETALFSIVVESEEFLESVRKMLTNEDGLIYRLFVKMFSENSLFLRFLSSVSRIPSFILVPLVFAVLPIVFILSLLF